MSSTKGLSQFLIYHGIKGDGAIVMSDAHTREEAEAKAEEFMKITIENLGDIAKGMHTYFVVENDR
tara:strand:+ start:16463 stop:16660 length:198 start_codon:yes stop_codon:yes gene_type:complete